MEGSEFIVMLLVKIIVLSKEKLMSLHDEQIMIYMSKEMVFDAFNKYGAYELLKTQVEDQSDFQLVWIEKDKGEFNYFKSTYPEV